MCQLQLKFLDLEDKAAPCDLGNGSDANVFEAFVGARRRCPRAPAGSSRPCGSLVDEVRRSCIASPEGYRPFAMNCCLREFSGSAPRTQTSPERRVEAALELRRARCSEGVVGDAPGVGIPVPSLAGSWTDARSCCRDRSIPLWPVGCRRTAAWTSTRRWPAAARAAGHFSEVAVVPLGNTVSRMGQVLPV